MPPASCSLDSSSSPLFARSIIHWSPDSLSSIATLMMSIMCVSAISSATVIHHGLDTSLYELRKVKKKYLSFLGRIAPVKGVHTAIEVARKSGIPLKIAGEIQPAFQDYFDSQIKSAIDGNFIEIGRASCRE